MANPQRGEVSFKALGQEWTLKWGTEAMCEAEDMTGLTMDQIGQSSSAKVMRALVWAALKQHHDVTLQDASAIIDEVGAEQIGALLTKASNMARAKQKGGATRPPKATAA